MALTRGTIAAGGTTAAGDLYTQISTVLTNASWTALHSGSSQTAATMGTTDVVYVWADPNATVSGTEYTGCILYIEVDNTNTRIRIRASEKYDTAPSGSPAAREKWCVGAGTTAASNTATTPTATYHWSSDSYLSGLSTVYYTNLPCSNGGFNYWIGANSSFLVVMNNSGTGSQGTAYNVCVVGLPSFLGSSGGSGLVAQMSNDIHMTSGNGAVAPTSNTRAPWRTSREPLTTTSLTGAFCYVMGPVYFGGTMAGGTSSSAQGTIAPFGGAPTFRHKWFTNYVIYQAYLHGATSSAPDGTRTLLAKLTNFAVWCANNDNTFTSQPSANMANYGPLPGDSVVAGGSNYVSLGHCQTINGTTNSASEWGAVHLLVNEDNF